MQYCRHINILCIRYVCCVKSPTRLPRVPIVQMIKKILKSWWKPISYSGLLCFMHAQFIFYGVFFVNCCRVVFMICFILFVYVVIADSRPAWTSERSMRSPRGWNRKRFDVVLYLCLFFTPFSFLCMQLTDF